MKKLFFVFLISVIGVGMASAQTWDDLSKEEKMMKAKKFRADNQNFLKNTLNMTDEQVSDIDNVNVCYLSTLDRINRYAQTDEAKENAAEAVTVARSIQLDAIMGEENREQFMEYVAGKLMAEE
jgi:hypothetical protein